LANYLKSNGYTVGAIIVIILLLMYNPYGKTFLAGFLLHEKMAEGTNNYRYNILGDKCSIYTDYNYLVKLKDDNDSIILGLANFYVSGGDFDPEINQIYDFYDIKDFFLLDQPNSEFAIHTLIACPQKDIFNQWYDAYVDENDEEIYYQLKILKTGSIIY